MGQSKRSHVLARTRWREQAARLVAVADPRASALRFRIGDIVTPIRHGGHESLVSSSGRHADAVVVSLAPFRLVSRGIDTVWRQVKPETLRKVGRATPAMLERCTRHAGPGGNEDVRFDVAKVRFYCEWVIAAAERRALDREVFADWTRTRWLGPENREPGAFVLSDAEVAIALSSAGIRTRGWRSKVVLDLDEIRRRRIGGWPGRLAREYGWARCSLCEGQGRMPGMRVGGFTMVPAGGGKDRCSACKGRGRVRKPGVSPGVAAGPGLARTAQRLLDTLDGRCPWAPGAEAQPGECQQCIGEHATVESAVAATRRIDRDRYAATRGRREPVTIAIHPAAHVLLSVTPAPTYGGYDSWLTVLSNIHVVRFEVAERPACCRGAGHNLAGVLPEVEPPRRRWILPGVTWGIIPYHVDGALLGFEVPDFSRAVAIQIAVRRGHGDPLAAALTAAGYPTERLLGTTAAGLERIVIRRGG